MILFHSWHLYKQYVICPPSYLTQTQVIEFLVIDRVAGTVMLTPHYAEQGPHGS